MSALTGLRGRMLLALVATSLATLGVAALVVLPPLERRVESDRIGELRGLARTIRPDLRDIPIRDRYRNSPALRALVTRLQRRAGGRIVVYDSAGNELADTGGREAFELSNVDVLREDVLHRRDGVFSGQRGNLAYALTVAGEPDRLTLVLTKRLDDSRAAATVMRAALPLALAAGLAFSLLLALLLSFSLMRRLRRLQDDAEALRSEGLEHKVRVTGDDEVAVVARALEGMRERLVEEQQSRQEFVSTASHELSTPLSSLQVQLELLREQAGDDALAARAEAALRQTHRLTALAADLLDISRVDGGARIEVEPLELGELARTIGQEFAPRLRSLEIDGPPALALADPAAVARILRVLLDNAVNYGAGAVKVSVAPEPGRAVLVVADEGPGLDEEERERIFRRFARGRESGNAHGAGLGLAIARGLARAMDGELEAVPSPVGARMVLTLPAA